jgi:hypothetical protein
MDKNCVERHRVRDELATDSEVRKGSKQPYVNAARIRGKISYLIRGGLPFLKAEVSRGRISRWSNDHPGRPEKSGHRAKGRTVDELSRKEKGIGEDNRNPIRPGRTWKQHRRCEVSVSDERPIPGRMEQEMAQHEEVNFVILDRTAGCRPACQVVWEGGGGPSPYPDFL